MSDKDIIQALEEENRIQREVRDHFKNLYEAAKAKLPELITRNMDLQKRVDQLLTENQDLMIKIADNEH